MYVCFVTNVTGLQGACFVVMFSLHRCFLDLVFNRKKKCLKEGKVRRKILCKHYCCHACHTRFAVMFPLPSYWASSLIELEMLRLKSDISLFASKICGSNREEKCDVILPW